MSQHLGGLEGIKTDIYYTIVHADTEIKKDRRLSSVPFSETQGQLVGSIKCSWWKFTRLDLTVNFHHEH